MKKLLIGMFVLVSASSFGSTIKHQNCKLNGAFYNSELNMILEGKGYTLYTGQIEPGTLNLDIESDSKTFDSHPLSVMACPVQGEKWAKFTDYASIQRSDGTNFFTVAQEETSYQACLQSGGEGKAERSIKRLLRNLPDCEVK